MAEDAEQRDRNEPAVAPPHQVAGSRFGERVIQWLLFGCAAVSVITTMAIVLVLITESARFFRQVGFAEFFLDTKWTPQFAEKHFGIWPLLAGTFLVTAIAAIVGLPTGLLAAIFMSEYAGPRLRGLLKPTLEVLAGIPTVVYGYFALTFITPYVLKPLFERLLGVHVEVYNALAAGIVVGIMVIPMVASISEDILHSVPNSLREAGYALGATRVTVVLRVVLPAALSGVLASFILAIARAIGETMAVTLAAGLNPRLTLNPLRSVETMTAYIVNVSLGDTPLGSIEYYSIYAVAIVLFAITLASNVAANLILARYREVYQ